MVQRIRYVNTLEYIFATAYPNFNIYLLLKFFPAANVVISVLELYLGFLLMVFYLPKINGIEPFLQLAQRNSSLIWISTPLCQIFGLGFFYLFYRKGHTWKRHGVVIGYEYQSEEKDKEESRMMTKFKGQWVSHTEISDNKFENEANNPLKDLESNEQTKNIE